MKLNTLSELLGGDIPSSSDEISGFCTDSRSIKPGNLFIAVKGERFDGHEFIEEAVSKGALAVLAEKRSSVKVPQFIVADPVAALAKIAAFHRQTMHCPIIALTGSNGKTSVKEMIAAILPAPSHATPGNLNNHLGVPLSVLKLNAEHCYAVFELGANHLGEIANTVAIVKPQVALVNNIAPAHIGGFGSIDAVAEAKGEIYQGLDSNGTAVINNDDVYAHFWDAHLNNKKVLRFSCHKEADISAEAIVMNEQGCAQFNLLFPEDQQATVNLQVPGEHMVSNALAAAACCYAVGLSLTQIVQGLSHFCGVEGRMTFRDGKNKSIIIDDTYNANLRSVLTAVDVLSKRQGFRILVFGDMGELGAWTQQHHEEVGRAARNQGIDYLMTCGIHSRYAAQAFGAEAKHYSDQTELTRDLMNKLNEDTTVLVKGSRSAAMEKIVHQLVR